jgi:hypothetical protein
VTPGAQYCTGIGKRKVHHRPIGDDRLSSHARPVRSVEAGGVRGGAKRVGVRTSIEDISTITGDRLHDFQISPPAHLIASPARQSTHVNPISRLTFGATWQFDHREAGQSTVQLTQASVAGGTATASFRIAQSLSVSNLHPRVLTDSGERVLSSRRSSSVWSR